MSPALRRTTQLRMAAGPAAQRSTRPAHNRGRGPHSRCWRGRRDSKPPPRQARNRWTWHSIGASTCACSSELMQYSNGAGLLQPQRGAACLHCCAAAAHSRCGVHNKRAESRAHIPRRHALPAAREAQPSSGVHKKEENEHSDERRSGCSQRPQLQPQAPHQHRLRHHTRRNATASARGRAALTGRPSGCHS